MLCCAGSARTGRDKQQLRRAQHTSGCRSCFACLVFEVPLCARLRGCALGNEGGSAGARGQEVVPASSWRRLHTVGTAEMASQRAQQAVPCVQPTQLRICLPNRQQLHQSLAPGASPLLTCPHSCCRCTSHRRPAGLRCAAACAPAAPPAAAPTAQTPAGLVAGSAEGQSKSQ